MIPPFLLSPGDSTARVASTKQWLASLAVAPAARAALNTAIDAIASGNRRTASSAIAVLTDVATAQLDSASAAELKELATELGG